MEGTEDGNIDHSEGERKRTNKNEDGLELPAGEDKKKKKTRGSSLVKKKKKKMNKDEGLEDKKTQKKEKREKKEKKKKKRAFAATLPHPRLLPSTESFSPASSGTLNISSSSGKLPSRIKSPKFSTLGGTLTWNDLMEPKSGLSSSGEDVEEWEKTSIPCTIGHFKMNLSGSEGYDVIPTEDDEAKSRLIDSLGGFKEEVEVDGPADPTDTAKAGAGRELELIKGDESGSSRDDFGSPFVSPTSSSSSLPLYTDRNPPSRMVSLDKTGQLSKLRSMEPIAVWRSLPQLAQSGDVSLVRDDGGRAERKKRTDMLWQELIDTEVNYVNNLNTIIQEFVVPLAAMASEGKGALTSGQVDLIFSRVTPLHAIHEALLKEFRRAESGACTLSDAFLTFMPFLKVYSTYVNKHPSAIELLIKLQRSSSRFRRFLYESMNRTGMDVESFLILPIQRLPRYELILNDLVRQTITCSVLGEHDKLKKLLTSIKEINTAVVESRKREESAERMYQIYATLAFPSKQKEMDVFDETIRVFVKEGMLDVCIPPSCHFTPRCFILFTDILICTVKKGSTMKFEYFFKLAHINAHSTGKDLALLFEGDNVFALADRKKSQRSGSRRSRSSRGSRAGLPVEMGNDNVIYLRAPSAEEKEAWVTELDQLCARAQAAKAKNARRSLTLPNLNELLEAEEREEEAKMNSVTEKWKSRRLSLLPSSTFLLSSRKPKTTSS